MYQSEDDLKTEAGAVNTNPWQAREDRARAIDWALMANTFDTTAQLIEAAKLIEKYLTEGE